MSEILGIALGVIVVVLLLFNFAEGIATGIGALFVGITRWVQKVTFGIDVAVVGTDNLVGREVRVATEFTPAKDTGIPEGYVVIDGERWRARSAGGTQCFGAGETLSVSGRDGLVLLVGQAGSS